MRMLAIAAIAAASVTPAFAQQATAVGTGIAASRSQSNSGAVAIGGGNATGGNATGGTGIATATGGQSVATGGRGGTGVGIGTGGNPTATINIAAAPSSTTSTINNQGTSTVRNVPSVFSPGLAAAGIETCLGSVSGGGSFVGTGFSFGGTIPDPSCSARLDSRTLWSFGLKKAAIARLCLNSDIYASMPEVCSAYLPQRVQQVGYAVAGPGFPTFPGWQPRIPSIAPEDNAGPVEVVVARTGEHKLCRDYDTFKHRCNAWVR